MVSQYFTYEHGIVTYSKLSSIWLHKCASIAQLTTAYSATTFPTASNVYLDTSKIRVLGNVKLVTLTIVPFVLVLMSVLIAKMGLICSWQGRIMAHVLFVQWKGVLLVAFQILMNVKFVMLLKITLKHL